MSGNRWEAALDAASVRATNLGRTLKNIKASFHRNELSAQDYFARMAAAVEKENATLDRLFVENQPPLHPGYSDERLKYSAGQARVRETIKELCKQL